MSKEATGNSGAVGSAREDRGPTCSPAVPLPARRSPSEHRPSLEVRGDAERRVVGGPPARREPEVRSPGIYPRIVTPGIETQNTDNQAPEPGMSARPDWIRLSGSDTQKDWLMDKLLSNYGEYMSTSGAMHYDAGAYWPCGILVSWRKRSSGLLIDMQGKYLSATPVDEFMNLTREIMMHGFHCTRIDLAVDHVDMNLDLYTNAVESCESECLCKLHTHAPNPEYKSDGTVTRRLLKMGQRGSAVCARIYDKGLQTKLFPCGHWERLEVEFKKEKAPGVCMALAAAGDELPQLIWRYVIGAIDFRIRNGRSELDRRPRCAWWDKYVGDAIPLLAKPIKKESGLESWCNHFRAVSGARLIQLSNILGITPHEFFGQLIEGLDPATSDVPATIDARSYSNQIMGTQHRKFEGTR